MSGNWYVLASGDEVGPLSDHQLRSMAVNGKLTPFDSVRKGASGDWVLARNVRGLFDSSASATSSVAAANHLVGTRSVTDGESPRDTTASSESTVRKMDSSSSQNSRDVPGAFRSWTYLAIPAFVLASALALFAVWPTSVPETAFQKNLVIYLQEARRVQNLMTIGATKGQFSEQLHQLDLALAGFAPNSIKEEEETYLARKLNARLRSQVAYLSQISTFRNMSHLPRDNPEKLRAERIRNDYEVGVQEINALFSRLGGE